MYNVLYFAQLVLNAEQLVGLHGVLPLFHVGGEAGELHRLVIGQLTCQQASSLEGLAELHDKLVEKGSCCPFVIFIVSHGSSSDAIERHPAVALAYVVLQRDARLAALGDASRNRTRIEVDQLFRDLALVEPQIVEVHLGAEEFGVLWLPLVDVKCNESHLLTIINCL